MDGQALRQLSVFRTVAEQGGITAAAHRLGKAPSAVHYDLKKLEQRVGRNLFDRVGRKLRLTPEGRRLAEAVARALGSLDRAYSEFLEATSDLQVLRLATVTGFGRYRLVPKLVPLLGSGRRIELWFGSHEQVVQLLQDGLVDLAVSYRPVTSVQIACEELALEEIAMVAPVRWHGRNPLELRFVTYDEYEYVFGRYFDKVLGAQPALLRRGDHVTELEEALAFVAAGRGATIVPVDAWLAGEFRGDLKIVRPTTRRCENRLYLLGMGGALELADADLIRTSASANAAE